MSRTGWLSEEGADMNRTRNKTIGTLAVVLAAAALVPSASSAKLGSGPDERTATELGQAVSEPGDQAGATADALDTRTPTELAQRVEPSVSAAAESSGFDWGDAAIGAGSMLGLVLIGFGGVALRNRRRDATPSSGVPLPSS
jgi:hypothetical protein